jgi:predicted  nucleic acid-binding Zn-ribbon protein
MAIDYRSELRRPLPFSLAVIAAVLLLWLIVASIAGARQKTARDHRIQDLETHQVTLRNDLDQQRHLAGTLTALQAKIAAAETQASQANQSGEQASAKAASLVEAQQAAERTASEAKAASEGRPGS